MPHVVDQASILIAVTPGSLGWAFSRLLVRQRAEEPEIAVNLIEAGIVDQAEGLMEGRYGAGLSLERGLGVAVASTPLWRDEIAVALPERSPLTALDAIPPEELGRHPLVMWSPEKCRSLAHQTGAVLSRSGRDPNIAEHVESFGLFATLVAAGYGHGLAGKRAIVEARNFGIVMRPLVGSPTYLTTYLLYPGEGRTHAVDRFIERARATAQLEQPQG